MGVMCIMSKKAKPAKKAAAKGPKYTFFVKKAIQDFAKDNNMMVGSDAYDAFNLAIHSMLSSAPSASILFFHLISCFETEAYYSLMRVISDKQ